MEYLSRQQGSDTLPDPKVGDAGLCASGVGVGWELFRDRNGRGRVEDAGRCKGLMARKERNGNTADPGWGFIVDLKDEVRIVERRGNRDQDWSR